MKSKLVCLVFLAACLSRPACAALEIDPALKEQYRKEIKPVLAACNYDESKTPKYVLEDPLAFADGTKLKDASEWPKRRKEILGIFAREMFGAEPPKPEAVVTEKIEEGETLGGQGIRRQVRMWFKSDKSGPHVDWLIVMPKYRQGPVPVILNLDYWGNHAILSDPEVVVPDGWVKSSHSDGTENRADPAKRGLRQQTDNASPYPVGTIIARGYALMVASYEQVSPDPDRSHGEDQEKRPYTRVFELWGPRDPSRTDNTTSIGAWAWALSRGLDYAERDPDLDAARAVVIGCSRLGKTALLAAARDDRFAVCIANQTGGGGVPLSKRVFGESVATEMKAFTHWYCAAYNKYANNEQAMPFDQHLLLACVAPRALLVQGYTSNWFDPLGEWLSVKAAAPAWAFLGKKGLPTDRRPDYYSTSAVGESLGYVWRKGEHGISAADWGWALDFADRTCRPRVAVAVPDTGAQPALVPAPKSMTRTAGNFVIKASKVTGSFVKFVDDAAQPAEGYAISVTPKRITVRASDAAGRFYALATLRQLGVRQGDRLVFPCVEIVDAPAYRYRGLMIDDARHFFGKDEIKRQLDRMAEFKLNVFHWHLTDDQGWRIEIKKYPKLTTVGSVRSASPVYGDNGRWDEKRQERVFATDGTRYGPFFYSQDDIREIVAYAKERFITIVPEIEIPGHSTAAIAAYPELSCPGCKTREPLARWGVEPFVYCAANPQAFTFLEDVLDEVIALFPGEFIHIGGDECQRGGWKQCPKCQKMIADEKLGDEKGLQAKFTKHFTEYLAKKGRRAIGWDEIVVVDIPRTTAVMSWRTERHKARHPEMKSGAEIAAAGFDVVMSPNSFCYLDYDQKIPGDAYHYPGRPLTLETVYSFDPAAGVSAAARAHVLGGQANAWSEHIRDTKELEWKVWPRAAALAEALWTAPASRDFADFQRRMAVRRAELVAAGFACAPVAGPAAPDAISKLPPPPAPAKESWGFLKDLRTRTPFRSHWSRQAAAGELNLAKGVQIIDKYGVAGDLETALVDLRRFLDETKIAGRAVTLLLAKGKVDGRESYRTDVTKGGVVLTAEDDDGLRRAIYNFERRALSSPSPALKIGSETRKPWLKNRISRCFFGPIKRPPFNHDELMDDVDYYPEAYLNRLAHEGVNGLWLTVSFRELARTSLTPTDPNADKRLEKLRATVAKCRRYGIKTWIFAIEPFSLPPDDPFLKAHPEIRGKLAWNHQHMLCPSEPVLRQYLREATRDIFTRVPGLGGVIDICHGERPTTCMSEVLDTETGEGKKLSCPKCSKRQPWEVFYDSLSPMIGGMREANPESEFVCWFYQPLPQVERADWVYDCAQHMPEGVIFQYNFESGACKRQEGKWRVGGDYWLSFAGPAIPFKRVAYAARLTQTPLSAKIQVGCSHEVATVPYVPAPGLLYRKYREMHRYGVSSVMMCWFFGNYPGVMNEAAGELAFETFEQGDEKSFLDRLARAQWGDLAPDVAALWESYTDGYMDYPLSNDMQYYGPVHAGVAWPLNPDIALDPLGRTWKPEDDPSGDCIAECLENHNLSEALALVRSMCRKADAGAAARLARLDAAADDRARKLDVGVMRALRCQFLSARDALEFYWRRREAVTLSRDAGDCAGALREVKRMKEIVLAEKEIDREMIPLCEYDARLGFHSEAENHQYHADKLRWRMARLDEAAARLDVIAAELAAGRPYPESALERTAPVWTGVHRTAAGDLVVSGRSPTGKAGTVDIHVFDRCGTVTVRHYTAQAKEDGTFEATLPATDWDGDRRLEPYWIRFRQGPYEHATSWPENACAPHRLCLFDVEGRRFGRLAISK